MGGFGSMTHWLILGILILLLFGGRNKISELMGDLAKGIKSFRKGMSDDDGQAKSAEPPRGLDHAGKPIEQAERDRTR